MPTELEEIELEERRLKLELMREQVETIRSKRESNRRKRADQARTEEFNRRKVLNEQASCAHRKGGRGILGIFSGNASDYSVLKQTEPWGETYVKCQRCGKEWRDPYFMLRKTAPEKVAAARKANPKEYKRLMDEYRAALDFPTDNEPSGGAVFGIQREGIEAAA